MLRSAELYPLEISYLSSWLNYLPAKMKAGLERRPNLATALSNTGWLFAEKMVRIGMGLLVGAWMARYLGPEQFGLLNYAMAFVALFGAVATLGLNGIVVRDLVRDPEIASATLGTAFVLQIVGGLLVFGLCVSAIELARPEDQLAKVLVIVLGFAMVFKAAEVVKCWFESQVRSRYTVWVESSAFLLFAAMKVIFILNDAPLLGFVWLVAGETALTAVGLLTMYAWQNGRLKAWRVDYARAKTLLKDSWPVALSGLAVMFYMRTDQIMLGQMLGDEAVGIYSAAVRVCEVWYFIPMAIIASVFPALMRIKESDVFEAKFQSLFNLLFVISTVIAVLSVLFAEDIIAVLYGREFQGAAEILSVYAWVLIFASVGVPSGRWYLYADLQMIALFRTVSGGVINVLLNLWWIPLYGPIGAAYATLISAAVQNVVFNALNHHTRHIFVMQMRAMSPRSLRSLIGV